MITRFPRQQGVPGILWSQKASKYKEHGQLLCSAQIWEYFENTDPKWSELGSVLDKNHILHVIDLIFG